MEDKDLSEQESLALIATMINRAKNRFSENGFLYLLWGWVVLACAAAQFILVTLYRNEDGYLVWLVTWLVVIFQIFYLRRKKIRESVRTYTDDLSAFIWLSFLAAMFVLIFVCIRFGYQDMINSVILTLYGVPVFLSGGLLKFRPLILGGIACWILAAISPFVMQDYRVLLVAVAIALAWILPGYLMKMRYKKENQPTAI